MVPTAQQPRQHQSVLIGADLCLILSQQQLQLLCESRQQQSAGTSQLQCFAQLGQKLENAP
jgi:hypothetical protein